MQKISQYITHPVFIFLLRIVLGSVFILSGLDKITNIDAFLQSIHNYQVVSPFIATLTATTLPWLELLCGIGLLIGVFPRTSSWIIVFLLVVFTGLVGSAMIRGLDISCGCFTQDPSAAKIGWQKIFENVMLIAAGVFLALTNKWNFALDNVQFRRRQQDHRF